MQIQIIAYKNPFIFYHNNQINQLKMNKLLKHAKQTKFLCQRFSTLKKFIEKRQQLNSSIDKIKFHDFCNQLIKVYIFDRVSNQLLRKTQKRLHRIALLDPQPKVAILQYYLKYVRRGFDDDLIASIFDLLGRIQNTHYEDRYTLKGDHKFGNELFGEPLFKDLIDQIKYGLQEGVYFSNKNIAKLIQGLIKLRFVDEQLITLILEKLLRKIQLRDDQFKMNIKESRKYHQMQKNNYYFEGEPIQKKKLLENQHFNKILELVLKKNHKKQKSNKQAINLKIATKQIFAQQASSIQQLISTITQDLNSSKQGIEKYTDAVLAIRQKYLILCKSQNEKKILSDPNLNLELLELEETLLDLKLINIDQVKNLSLLQNIEYNKTQVEKIIRNKLQTQQDDVVYFLEKIIETNLKQKDDVQIKSNFEEEMKYLGLCLTKIGQLAELNVNPQQNKQFLSDGKWKRAIKQEIGDSKVFYVDRIFKSQFMKVQEKLSEYLPNIQKVYHQKKNARCSVFFLNALTLLGRHEVALNLFQKLEFDHIEQYNLEQLFQLIQALNNVGEYLSSQKLTQDIINRLTTFVNNGTYFSVSKHFTTVSNFTMRLYEQATVINWLENLGLNHHDLYIVLTKNLKEFLDGIQNPLAEKSYGYAADIFRNEFKYMVTLVDRDNPYLLENYINPINNIVLENVKKFFEKIKIHQDSTIELGFFDLKNQTPTILSILPTQFTSLSGKFIDGNMRAYLKRISIQKSVNVQTIRIGSLLSFDFPNQLIELRNRQSLRNEFEVFLNRQQGPVYNLSKQLLQWLALKNQSIELSVRDIKAIRKISNSIQNILKLNRNERFQDIHQVAVIMRHKVRYALILLLKDFTLLSQNIYNQIVSEDYINKINQLIVQLGEGIKIPTISSHNEFEFIGKRQTIQTIGQFKHSNLDFQFIDLHTYHHKPYCEYTSWAQLLKSSLGEFNVASIPIQKASLLTKLFLNGYHANKNESLSIGPTSGIRNIVVTPHPLHWENIYKYRKTEQTNEALQVQAIARTEIKSNRNIELIIQLQNFKQELKTKPLSFINELLVRLEFIEDLIQNHLNKKTNYQNTVELIPRDPSDYFTYLQQKSKNYLLNSPFIHHMLEKIQKKQKLKNLVELRQRKITEWSVLVRQNKLAHSEYIKLKKQLQKQIINELQTYKNDVIQQRLSILSSPSLKMFKTQINQLQFANFLNRLDFYDREEDNDVILEDGNLEQALAVKRYKAQERLIKLRLSYKLHNQIPLSEVQRKYLENWKLDAENMDKQHKVSKSFTQLKTSDLTQNDKQVLNQFTYTHLNQVDLPLTQFILEFSLFFDETAIKNIDSKISQNYLKKKYGLPQYLFENGKTKESSFYLGQLEKRKFDDHNKLTEEQLNHIIEASKLMKIQNPMDKMNYNHIYANLVQDLNLINQISCRTDILTQWYIMKEEQFDKKYRPDMINDFKAIETKKIWKRLLGKTYQQSTSNDIKIFIHALSQRLYLIKKNPPVYFTQLVIHLLTHPRTNIIDQKILIGTLQVLKYRLAIDSEDLKLLAIHFDNKVLSEAEIMKRIQQCSSKDYSGKIYSQMIKL